MWLRPSRLWCLLCSRAEQGRAKLTARLLTALPWLPGLEMAPGSPPTALFCPCLHPFLCEIMLPCPLFLSGRHREARDTSTQPLTLG